MNIKKRIKDKGIVRESKDKKTSGCISIPIDFDTKCPESKCVQFDYDFSSLSDYVRRCVSAWVKHQHPYPPEVLVSKNAHQWLIENDAAFFELVKSIDGKVKVID